MTEHLLFYSSQVVLFCTVVFGLLYAFSLFKAAGENESEGAARSVGTAADEARMKLIRNALTVVVFLLFSLSGSVAIAAIAAGISFIVPMAVMRNNREKRTRRVETQLVEALELLGSSIKSGLTLPQASALVVQEFPPPISEEFNVVLAETRLGVDFVDALSNMAGRLRSNIVQILASGVAVTKRSGGDMTQIFQNIAQVIRDQASIEGKLSAVTAQGRFQGLILGLMPFALMIVLYFVDPSHIEVLFGYKFGLVAVGAVVGMVILAQVWIRKLLDIDV